MTSDAFATIGNSVLELRVATGYGPRITALIPTGGPNLFAELGNAGIELADGRRFHFRGGHRLWAAPETPSVTYEPDDDPVEIVDEGRRLRIIQGGTREIEKVIEIQVDPHRAVVTVNHQLINRRGPAVDVAPWAITQFRPGGVGLLPLPRRPLDTEGLRANTAVIGWPYTDWAALGYDDENQIVEVPADRTTPTKVGTGYARGWLGYRSDDWLFIKTAEVSTGPHADLGAQAQIYCTDLFLELETQGAMVPLQPGAAVEHTETWRVYRTSEFAGALAEVDQS